MSWNDFKMLTVVTKIPIRCVFEQTGFVTCRCQVLIVKKKKSATSDLKFKFKKNATFLMLNWHVTCFIKQRTLIIPVKSDVASAQYTQIQGDNAFFCC